MTKAIRVSPLLLALSILVLTVAPLGAENLPRTTPEEVGMSTERLGRLTEVLQGYVVE